MRRSGRLFAVALWVAGSGCGEGAGADGAGPDDFIVRDSAGVRISVSTDSAWTEETAWRVGSEPVVVIGGLEDGPAEAVFGAVSGVAVRSDGGIVVADGLANEIRVFGPDGRYERTLGGEGEGPDEFGRLDRIAVIRGDTVVGRDVSAFKTVYFAPDGSGHRTVDGPGMFWNDLRAVYVDAWTESGGAIVSHTLQSSDYPPGTNLLRSQWHLFGLEGEHRGLVGELPWGRVRNEGPGAGRLAFSGRVRTEGTAQGFWFLFTSEPVLTHYGPGGVDRIVRLGLDPRPIPDAVEAAYRSWYAERFRSQLEGAPPQIQEDVEARIENLTFADHFPVFGGFLLSEDGYFWLEHGGVVDQMLTDDGSWAEDPAHPERWTVLSPEGRWLGTVELPDGVRLRAVTPDRIVGERSDELDVESVVVYELDKG